MPVSREEIEVSLALSVCTGWDREFLESVIAQMEKGRTLSGRQEQVIKDVLARNTPADDKAHATWAIDYAEQYASRAKVVATYYARTQYYQAMALDILKGSVPERKAFLRMMDNKYATKILEEAARPPRYTPADHIAPRAAFDSSRAEAPEGTPWEARKEVFMKFGKNGGFILEVCGEIHSAAKNSKRYKILPIGATFPIIIEERYLKLKRK